MSVTLDPNAGFASTTLPNADQSAVSYLKSSNSGQPQGAAFNQFQGVVADDQITLNKLGDHITTLEATNNLSPDQQADLLSSVQQFESISEKFKSDNAHLLQLAAADNSTPEALQTVEAGNTEATNIRTIGSQTQVYASPSSGSGVSPAISTALGVAAGSIIDQANALRFNNNLTGIDAMNPSTNFGSGGADKLTGVGQSGASISSFAGTSYLPGIDPAAVASLASTNSGQPQGQAFASFAQVVTQDQAQLNSLAARLSMPASSSADLAATASQYEKVAEKFTGDQAHLLQLATADNSGTELTQARAFGTAAATLKTAAADGRTVGGPTGALGQVQSELAALATSSSALTDADKATVGAAANSLQDQINAIIDHDQLTR